ncbi:MAG: peptidoglycan-associated lipoprotein Pal [Nitrospirales bacterium]|nr:peptidoglycan-associated lipoprotein Pal [Nitrospirales bacterium]
MKRLFPAIVLLLIAGLFLFTGCAKKAVKSEEQPVTKAPETRTPAETAKPSREKEAVEDRTPPAQGTEDKAAAPLQEIPSKIQDVYFDYDRYDIKDEAKPALKELAAFLSREKDTRVVVEGHCDERGTNEYNLALGDKRANAAKDYLISLGIPSKRIETVSYGEEKPACKESTEECWAKNRRAHFVLVEERR